MRLDLVASGQQHQLADPGVTFSKAFVSNSVCCPSRASILTGQYSNGTGVYQNGGPEGGYDSFDPSSTIATWLHDDGYTTALVGKYLNEYGEAAQNLVFPPGWDTWRAFAEDNGKYYDYDEIISENGGPATIQHFYTGKRDYSTNNLMRQALSFIDGADKPFFLYFAPYAPHGRAQPWPGDEGSLADMRIRQRANFNERDVSDKPLWVQELDSIDRRRQAKLLEKRRQALEALVGVDRAVGRIVEELVASGQLDNTIIIFTSDNSFLFGEHRWHWKDVPYEEAIRVPMIVRYDDLVNNPGRTDKSLVVNIDLAPTIADLAGVSAPGADGDSFVPILKDNNPPWREDFLLEHLNDGGVKRATPTYCGIRSEDFAYVYYSTGEEELYDLGADPFELHNKALSASYQATMDAMHARVTQLCNPVPPDPGFILPPWA